MTADDYQFSPKVFVDDKEVSINLPYHTYNDAVNVARDIIDAEWQDGHKLEVFIDLVAIRYDKSYNIQSWWTEKTLYHLLIKADK